jgi:hypothetical protein
VDTEVDFANQIAATAQRHTFGGCISSKARHASLPGL